LVLALKNLAANLAYCEFDCVDIAISRIRVECRHERAEAAPWMIGPKVISRQWFSKKSRSKAASAASSTGKQKTSMAEPSTSIMRRGRLALDREASSRIT
jgi:hypothetical protein